MNTLIVEGESYVRYCITEFLNSYHPIVVSNISDLIYHVFYTDTVFDNIIIGDELMQTNCCLGVDDELDHELEKLRKCRYFPVTLGEICKTLSKKAGKAEPNVIIMSTFSYYPFNGTLEETIAFIESKNMRWIDKTQMEKSNFAKDLESYVVGRK